MKQRVLEEIYRCFAAWSAPLETACRKGCAVCCTGHVTITAVEAELILRHLESTGRISLLRDMLAGYLPCRGAERTTNEYAEACLQEIEADPAPGPADGACPFLFEGICSIYPARPFNCRCFASTVTCRPGTAATLPAFYLSGATAVNQIIEHLDQGRIWGTMLHVLYILGAGAIAHGDAAEHQANLRLAASLCRRSHPLPAFLLDERDYRAVAPLLDAIFKTPVDGRPIETILNGGRQE